MASQISLNNLDFSRPLSMHEEWWFDEAVNHPKRLLDAIPSAIIYSSRASVFGEDEGYVMDAKHYGYKWIDQIATIYTQPALIEYHLHSTWSH